VTTVTERGEGPVLLLIHGSLNDHRYWSPQVEAFAAAGRRVVAPSLRHYWPARWDGTPGTFRIDDHVEDVARLIRGFDAGPVDVVGHSRGGYVAFRLAERHGALLRRLVLAEPAGVLAPDLLPAGTAPANYGALIGDTVALARAGETEAALRAFYDYALGAGSWDGIGAERQGICRDNASTLLGQAEEGRTPYDRAAVAAIRAPTLLIEGGATQPAFASVVDGLATARPDWGRAIIPGATHTMNWDDPAAFNSAVMRFLG
jgi:pimeloyl-ACP methyl ester carboxylesterase